MIGQTKQMKMSHEQMAILRMHNKNNDKMHWPHGLSDCRTAEVLMHVRMKNELNLLRIHDHIIHVTMLWQTLTRLTSIDSSRVGSNCLLLHKRWTEDSIVISGLKIYSPKNRKMKTKNDISKWLLSVLLFWFGDNISVIWSQHWRRLNGSYFIFRNEMKL